MSKHFSIADNGSEHTLTLTTEELKAIQYWFSMAHLGRAVNEFTHGEVDDSAMNKIHEALYEERK